MTQAQAMAILKTGANVFLTGEPGSGKTHVIREYAFFLRGRGINPAITASTGIAATHIGGMTIHSWSGIGIKKIFERGDLEFIASNSRIKKRVRDAKVLVIDEISMLAPETLVLIDAVCRRIKDCKKPFGGIQIVFVGDFFQLPPVARAQERSVAELEFFEKPLARFAFDSPAWIQSEPIVCYLSEQYRQDDADFLAVLTAIRRNVFGAEELRRIQSRKVERSAVNNRALKLFSRNVDVDRLNEEMLSKLSGECCSFEMLSRGRELLVAALKRGCLSLENVKLKIGAAVMFTKNNLKDGFVNGTLGTVLGFNQTSGFPIVKMRNGKQIEVEPVDWTFEEDGRVRAEITQLPLRLAWAMTVHKSQGMSLDEAVMDLSDVFEFGQGYVALSRVRRFSGLYILGWNERAFQVHPEIFEKDQKFRSSAKIAEATLFKLSADELKKMQDNFVIACGGQLGLVDVAKKQNRQYQRGGKIDTCAETLVLWKQDKSVAQIARARGLKSSTILAHIEKLASQKKISRGEISRLLTPSLTRDIPIIQAVFQELDTDSLLPVFEKLAGRYSYDELRIARMMCFDG